jgi:tetratricopeptide (TPR) repeat protein
LTTESENKALIVHSHYELTVPERALIERGILLAQSREAFIFFVKGILCEREGKYGDALRNYKKVAELYPKCTAAYYRMGAICRVKRLTDQAIANYTSVIEIEPENFFAYYYRGLSHQFNKQYDQAISDYNKALETVPTMKDSFMKKRFTYRWIYKLDYSLLKKWVSFLTPQEEKVLRLSVGIGERPVYDDEGTFLNLHSEPISGKTFYPYVKRYFNDLYYSLSLAHASKKEYEKAMQYINKTLDLKPNFGNAYSLRGLLHWRTHQRQQAIADFKKAIEINPKDNKSYKNLAEIYGAGRLLSLGEKKGFLTYDEVNDLLPEDIVLSDQIDDIIWLMTMKNIDIIDVEKGEKRH